MFNKWKVFCLFIGFHFFIHTLVSAQDQKLADSLSSFYKAGIADDSAKLRLLFLLSFNEVRDLKLALNYAEELISLSISTGNNKYLHSGYFQKGNKKKLFGDLEEALAAYIKSAEVAQLDNNLNGEANAYGAIADIYSISKQSMNAMLYYHKAIDKLSQTSDYSDLASTILNAGEEFYKSGMYDSANYYLNESLEIFEKLNYSIGIAYSLGNIGMVYARTGENDLAEKNIKEAIQVLEEFKHYYTVCEYLISMSDIYLEKGDIQLATNYASKSLTLAQQYGLKEQISDANRKLAELYESNGDFVESYRYYKNYIAYRDSVNNIKMVQGMADLRTNFEVSQKQTEVDLLSQKRKNQRIINIATSISTVLIFILAISLFKRYQYIKETNRIIGDERERSEKLLLNILPEETSLELKKYGQVKAKKFESVTVLFADFKEFTKIAETVDPEVLVKSIDFYFKEFDRITTQFGLEKIKTIGDEYMCAGGIPVENKTHALSAILAAKKMNKLIEDQLHSDIELIQFELRIGIHTGPVVAGIVGLKKWQYDIWGDTVNIASRMQSMSEPGRINLSESTYNEIKDEFPCEYRGEMEVKHRGSLKMYFLSNGQ